MSCPTRAMVCLVGVLALLSCCWAAELECRNVSDEDVPSADLPTALNKDEAALLLLLGFGGLSILLALLYVGIRHFIFNDVHNLDSTFDAGGDVSASLTAVTIAAQLLWPADLQQSVTVAVKFGIAGAFWYCAAVLVNLSLFPLLSFKFKTKAPGAKTYLQIIFARCGRKAHTVFCVFAILVNLVILASIIVGGIAVFQTTIKDASAEYCIMIMAVLCGSYSLIGGLGSTFYVSYFNALTTFVVLSILVINIFYVDDLPYGSLEEIYAKINCLPGPEGNSERSYFTFLSEGAVLWAIQGVFVVSSITYCDQASWQSRIAAKPLQGAIGFLLAGVIWFACPATIGTVAGITYLALSYDDPSKRLSNDQINSGIVSAYMAQQALGRQGGVMMLTMLTMLTMSTGSGEIMGISSIIVYDIYQPYIRPFRFQLPMGHCIFCGLKKPGGSTQNLTFGQRKNSQAEDTCKCPPALTCSQCKDDLDRLQNSAQAPGRIVQYRCPHHGDFRAYQDSLINFKNWCILWVTLALVPFGLALNAAGLDLNWTMMTGIIILVPCFPGVILCIVWVRLTGTGLIIGSLVGLVCGISADLIVAYVHFEGAGGFLISTSELYSVVAGSATGMVVSLVLTVTVSLCTHQLRTEQDVAEEWEKMRNIDNPLHPWALHYAREFPEVADGITRPSTAQLEHVERHGRLVSIIGSIIFLVIFVIIIPACMASLEILDASEFSAWTTLIIVWCFVMAIVIILVTPMEEIRAIYRQLKAKRKNRDQQERDGEGREKDRALEDRKEDGGGRGGRGNGETGDGKYRLKDDKDIKEEIHRLESLSRHNEAFEPITYEEEDQTTENGPRQRITTVF